MNSIKVEQTPRFRKAEKKFPQNIRNAIKDEVKKLIENPLLGEQKKGDLAELRVHKFKVKQQQYLLGYTFNNDKLIIILIAIGTHENYYRDIKRSS